MKKYYIKQLDKIFKFILISTAFIIVFSIPAWFIFSASILEPLFDKILQVKVDPAISGGIIISKFYDDTYDDNGDGTYQYPLHENFTESNICDIISYEVYRPVLDNGLEEPLAYWQVAVSFSKLINPFQNEGGYSNIQIAIYIDIDKTENGSNYTFYENAEYIEFPSDYGWDIMILANGLKKDMAKLFYSDDIVKKFKLININNNSKNYEKEYSKDIRAIFVKEQNKIYFQIPLDNKFIQKVLDGRQTFHWVFSGLYDAYASGGWLNVKENPSIRAGGGLKWDSGPRIYDLITPQGFDQKFLLSEANASINGLVVIPPLISGSFNGSISYLKEGKIIDKKNNNLKNRVSDKLSDSKNQSNIDKQQKIKELIKKIEEDEKNQKIAFEKDINEKLNSKDEIERLFALFSSSRFNEAKILAEKILKENAENPVALAYMGSLIAMEGGKTKNPMQAINLVNKAYEYLDKAVWLMRKIEENNDLKIQFENQQKYFEYYIIVLSNRAIVSSSVPDQVFNKLDVAIDDFQKISQIYEKLGKTNESALSLMQTALLLEKKNKIEFANIIWLTLLKYKDLPPKVELELVKRGFK